VAPLPVLVRVALGMLRGQGTEEKEPFATLVAGAAGPASAPAGACAPARVLGLSADAPV
jgi:hypothetical protein